MTKAVEASIGKRFGKLVVLGYAGLCGYNKPYVTCQCDCGRTKKVRLSNLISKDTRSCGCYRKPKNKTRVVQEAEREDVFRAKSRDAMKNKRRMTYSPMPEKGSRIMIEVERQWGFGEKSEKRKVLCAVIDVKDAVFFAQEVECYWHKHECVRGMEWEYVR